MPLNVLNYSESRGASKPGRESIMLHSSWVNTLACSLLFSSGVARVFSGCMYVALQRNRNLLGNIACSLYYMELWVLWKECIIWWMFLSFFFFWYTRDTFRTTGLRYLQFTSEQPRRLFFLLFLSSCLIYSLSVCPGGNPFVNDYFRYCPLNLFTNSVYFLNCRIWLCLLQTCYTYGRRRWTLQNHKTL